MVPTPPPAAAGPYAPPVPPPPQVDEPEEISDDDDDLARRSSARPSLRRMSHDTPRSSREKPPSHKKSSSSRDHQPIIVEAGSPPARTIPPLSRSQTESYPRPIPITVPRTPVTRAETWYPTTERERERNERSQSRPTFTEDEDSAGERHHRRNRRTKSPEPTSGQVRYAVDGTKSIPIRQKHYHEQAPRGAYKTKGAYVMPNSSQRVKRGQPSYTRDYYEPELPQHFTGVKYASQFDERDINYSDLPYKGSSYQSNVFA